MSLICCGRQRFSENKEWTLAESIGGCRGEGGAGVWREAAGMSKNCGVPDGKRIIRRIFAWENKREKRNLVKI